MIKIGVLGAGHLGKIHIKLIKELDSIYDLVGFYDPSDDNAKLATEQYDIKRYENLEDLLAEVDDVDIVTQTVSNNDCASKAIRSSKLVFIEKPVTETFDEAKSLFNLVEENLKANYLQC